MSFGTVTNLRGSQAPRARNWVSKINQNRQKDVNDMKDRQTTKYATLRFYDKTGTAVNIIGNSGNTITGANKPENIFHKTNGVVATTHDKYTPPNIVPEKITFGGTLPTDNEWIIWKGSTQFVQIEGTLTLAPSDGTARTYRLQIHINDQMVGSVLVNGANDQEPQSATIDPIKQFGSGSGLIAKEIKVSYVGRILTDQTVKLMVDHLSSTSVYATEVYNATLTVKTLPMS